MDKYIHIFLCFFTNYKKNRELEKYFPIHDFCCFNFGLLFQQPHEYYQVFITQDEKLILTFLLYALYYLNKKSFNFNYDELLKFLKKHKNELLKDETCLKLLCLCYKKLDSNRELNKKETLELMDDNFRKVISTNLKINVDLKKLTDEEIQEIITNNKVVDNINDVIWYLNNCIKDEWLWLI